MRGDDMKTIKLSEVVGKGYGDVWNSRCRYVIIKGSRASKKSKTTALWHIYHMMKYPLANSLVIRKTERTLKDSCFSDLRWAIHRLGVDHLWQCKMSPLEIVYKPTGQKILFRGLDDPLKITSISVDVGFLCWVWFEELYEILSEEDFDFVDESVRGELPEGYFKRITGTMNPWSDQHWVKARFFDTVDDNVLAVTKNYELNEWLGPDDLAMFEDMKKNRPKRYEVAGLGNWGITDGVIYENWRVEDLTEMIPTFANIYNGLDFGTTDPNALIRFDIERGQKKIYVFDEYYKGNVTFDELAPAIYEKVHREVVTCDSAAHQMIIELCSRGINAVGAVKGPGSVNFGIQWLQGYDIIVHKDCVNFIREISQYCWEKDKFGKPVNRPVDGNDHLLDALRYGAEPLMLQGNVSAAVRL